jgi:parallel beta-helix repeat protein
LLSGGFSDGFEAPTLNPFWSTQTQSGSITLSSALAHTGSQSVEFDSSVTSQAKAVFIYHTFTTPTYGDVSVWVYDNGAGVLSSNYLFLDVHDSQDSRIAEVFTDDYDLGVGNNGHDYDFNVGNTGYESNVNRTQAWHQFQINDDPSGLSVLLDGQVLYSGASQAAIGTIQVGIGAPSWRPAWTAHFDDFAFNPLWTVTNLNDSGPGSLRDVISQVNSDPIANGTDSITFASDISGGTIALQTPLPALTRGQVTITGPVTLNGASAGGDGLDISGNQDNVQGLSITSFSGTGISITGSNDSVAGSQVTGNGTGIALTGGATGNTIGGTVSAARDVISGNKGAGVLISGAGTTGNFIVGDYVGTNAAGTAALGNGSDGVAILNGASRNTVSSDVISGNGLGSTSGAREYTPDANTVLLDHFDGSTTAQYVSSSVQYVPGFSGLGQAVSLPSGGWLREAFTPWFDWENPGSPQGTVELWIDPQSYNVPILTMQWYQANSPPGAGYILGIGLDANGRLTLSGWNHTDPNLNVWAKPFPSGQETIPLNKWTHIAFTWSPQGSSTYINGVPDAHSPLDYYPGFWPNAIPTEYIYLNGWGSSAFGQMDELRLSNVARTEFGTIVPSGAGVYISGAGTTGNLVAGDDIGTDATGSAPLGNGSDGVIVLGGATQNTIGGTVSGAGNTIAFNGGNGVTIGTSPTDASTGDEVLGNAIYANANLGIDLGNDGVTKNDSEGHAGPNLFQDFPVLTSASSQNGTTTITGSIAGAPSTAYRVEFFAEPVADPSGYGQGRQYLGSRSATTDSTGKASFVATVSSVPVGQFVSATATGPGNNTSEFSADIPVLASPYVVTNTSDSGPGSLRQAILNADANDSVPQTISFNIPKTDPGYTNGVFTIQPLSPLPVLSQNITIDGTTQAAFTGNTNPYGPVIVLNGAKQSSGDGLDLVDNNTVKGLVINGFPDGGIYLSWAHSDDGEANNNQILDNYLGTDPTGTKAVPNGFGVGIVGYASPSEQSTGNLVQGNLISGNSDGIELGDTNRTQIIGNLIGTDRTGAANLGNSGDGIWIGNAGCPLNTIEGNTIAYNKQDGIEDAPDYRYSVAYTTSGHQGNAFLQNSIFSNGMLGIDLIAPGTVGGYWAPQGVPLQNTPGGPHQGANLLQNYPVLSSAVSSASGTAITGTLNSTPNETFHLEFFASPTANASGYGEGKTYLGSTSVTTDASGNASFSLTVPVGNLVGQVLSATATDPGNNTSEFSKDILIRPSSSATFLKADSTTKGNWVGAYGRQGYDIEGFAPGLPSYATVSLTGASSWTWASSTTDPRGLENPSGSGRTAQTWYGGSFTFDVNLTDGQVHDVALYAVDWDNRGRQEQVQVIDPATGKVLDTESLASSSGGAYLQWKVGGHVQIRVTRLAGPNAVLSGLFLDPTSTGTASFVKKDTTTQGTWVGRYGGQGYDVEGFAPSLPSYATVNLTGASTYTWAASTADPRALEDPPSGPARSAQTWYGDSFTIDVNLTDGQSHDLALYAVDWDNRGREEQIQVIDPATGKALDTEVLWSFSGGAYLQWKVSGHVQIRVTALVGPNAVVSSLFLDPASGAAAPVGPASGQAAVASALDPGAARGLAPVAGPLGVAGQGRPAAGTSDEAAGAPPRSGAMADSRGPSGGQGSTPVAMSGPRPDGALLRAAARRFARQAGSRVTQARLVGQAPSV